MNTAAKERQRLVVEAQRRRHDRDARRQARRDREERRAAKLAKRKKAQAQLELQRRLDRANRLKRGWRV